MTFVGAIGILAEMKSQGVPKDIAAAVQTQTRMLLGTRIVEESFHRERRQERASANGVLGRKARWQTVIHDGLLEDFDRRQPQVSSVARSAAAKHSPGRMFGCKADGFSLGLDVLHEVAKGPPTKSPEP